MLNNIDLHILLLKPEPFGVVGELGPVEGKMQKGTGYNDRGEQADKNTNCQG
jgi:hypothetical protein